MKEKSLIGKINKRYLILSLLLLVGLYVLVPQLGDFKTSWQLLRSPNLGWTSVAVILTLATYLAAALNYYLLAFKPLRYWRTVIAQLAAMFVNRLLPGGVGALGVNFLYLKRNHHSSSQAATTVTVNNLLGFAGHFLLLALTLVVSQEVMLNSSTNQGSDLWKWILFGLIVLVIAGTIGGRRVKAVLLDVKTQLFSYRHRPGKLLLTLGSSVVLTLTHVISIYACAQALGVSIGLGVALLVLTLGVGAGIATPTPGGLGGFEAGMVAILIAYNVESSAALAIALLYRFISYWLMLAVGGIAFVVTQRRGYI